MFAPSCLDAGLLVDAEYVIARPHRCTFPPTLVEIDDAAGFAGKLGIAREYPAAMAPRLQRIRTQPAPKRHATDLRHDTAGDNLPLEFRDRQARERYAVAGGDLTGQALNLDDDAGGESGLGARREAVRPARLDVQGRTDAAIC